MNDHYTLQHITNDSDLKKLADFNGMIHEPLVAAFTSFLVERYPYAKPRHFFFLENTDRDIISSMCLIKSFWDYWGIPLTVGELGIVGTRAEYRNQGLIRRLYSHFDTLAEEEECDISIVQGIPNFYRQFGYEYAIQLERDLRVDYDRISTPEGNGESTLQPASFDDLPLLKKGYELSAGQSAIHGIRSDATWEYLINNSFMDDGTHYYLLFCRNGEPQGYITLQKKGFFEGLIVTESSLSALDDLAGVLHLLKATARQQGKPYLRLNLPDSNPLAQFGRAVGGHDGWLYCFQIKLVNTVRFLKKIAPVLEKRLQGSPFERCSGTVCFNFYKEAVRLTFAEGKIIRIEGGTPEEMMQGVHHTYLISIPKTQFVQLAFGWKSREELASFYPDIAMSPWGILFVERIFPRCNAWVHALY